MKNPNEQHCENWNDDEVREQGAGQEAVVFEYGHQMRAIDLQPRIQHQGDQHDDRCKFSLSHLSS